ncbi:MAG: hypothetical protein SGPRY_009179, partial [Prymnesium sp.]
MASLEDSEGKVNYTTFVQQAIPLIHPSASDVSRSQLSWIQSSHSSPQHQRARAVLPSSRGSLPSAAQRGTALPSRVGATPSVLAAGSQLAPFSSSHGEHSHEQLLNEQPQHSLAPSTISQAIMQVEANPLQSPLIPWLSPCKMSRVQLGSALVREDAHRGRDGRLPVSEVKRVTALYHLKLSAVDIESAITRASAKEDSHL